MSEKDVTDLIERLEAFEDRLGVDLEGLFAKLSERGHVEINGELHLREGTELSQDIDIVATIYDSSGRVLEVNDRGFYSDSFFGFEAFSFFFGDVGSKGPAKIRVYPKAG